MAKVTFIEHNGKTHEVDMDYGQPLMQIALDNMVPGIDADCGGECACGTCHVIVAKEWVDRTGRASSEELQMLEMTPEKSENSRLACQIIASEALDGLVVQLPEFQM